MGDGRVIVNIILRIDVLKALCTIIVYTNIHWRQVNSGSGNFIIQKGNIGANFDQGHNE